MMVLGPALNTNGKPRAQRGSPTDPQSIYARVNQVPTYYYVTQNFSSGQRAGISYLHWKKYTQGKQLIEK